MSLKATYDEGGHFEVTISTHLKHFKLSTKLVKNNEKLETNVDHLKDYIKLLENRNKIFGEEYASIRSKF